MMNRSVFALSALMIWLVSGASALFAQQSDPVIYRTFHVEEENGLVTGTEPIQAETVPRWARDVLQEPADVAPRESAAGRESAAERQAPMFKEPIPFVVPPAGDSDEPFYEHNHQPAVAWLPNGDLLAAWYTTREESGTELTVLASRLRAGENEWDPAAEFFKAEDRNMHGTALFLNEDGTLFHFNGMGAEGQTYWAELALLMRTSRDNGVSWSPPKPIGPEIKGRHQVISGTVKTSEGLILQPADAAPTSYGGTALHISRDGGRTWTDPGADQPDPEFVDGEVARGTVAGIHAGVVELDDGRWMALGRGDEIDDRMPMSISDDEGETWTYSASPFPPVGRGQRLVLKRLQEGPILLVSFTGDMDDEEASPVRFVDERGTTFEGRGLFAALSFDNGESWPVRRLLTPGSDTFDGGAWTGEFEATPRQAEPGGYLAATQAPDGTIHLLSSRLHYRFNLAWLTGVPTLHNVEF